MTLVQLYEVWYTRNGQPECYAKGLTLDNAQTTKASLAAAGTITLAITGNDGYQSGGKLTQAITDVRVERAVRSGDSDASVTAVTEALTVSTSGQTLFSLANTPDLNQTMTVTVEGSSARPDVLWKLVNSETTGTPMLLITVPFLTTTSVVSASYSYQNLSDETTISDETATGTPDGSRTTYTSAYVYKPGSLVVTTSVSAVSAIYVTDGGGKTFEVLAGDIGYPYQTRVALPTGTVVKLSYKYSYDDNVAVPSAETHTTTLPTWGTALHPPFQW